MSHYPHPHGSVVQHSIRRPPHLESGKKMQTFDVLTYVAHTLRAGERVAVASILCVAVEIMLPYGKVSFASRARGILFHICYLFIGGLFFELYHSVIVALHIRPLFSISLDGVLDSPRPVWHATGIALAIAGAILIGDLLYYWFHRAQHTFGFLWRFHQVHHSIREMNVWNCNMHVSEELLRPLVVTLPMALLIDFHPPFLWSLIGMVILIQGTFEHADTRISFGPISYLFPDNRFHRIHHSVELRHYNRNFAAVVTLWDVLFGTAHFPKKGEWPEVGLDYTDEPDGLVDYLLMPFTVRLPATAVQDPSPRRTE
ncbi:sterol desaturase/sphingolipid hydroxylase (fatty acid hydroxylase superfamily) [Paraburkholderia sp. CI2]|uniref:sterol desaturase family protein n=2 Tax=unclassified Paraburkholderia TaxID=2615204 RepID=UPI00183DF3DF|nr:sterol desaturase family protein [Paraburkholderia sp. CI2]MBB5471160.1 sterol desaturase/sphingolipid hydroxylase (fatty acid hydroxylase superfamily) [Paraburkholderia sp. CI2]